MCVWGGWVGGGGGPDIESNSHALEVMGAAAC